MVLGLLSQATGLVMLHRRNWASCSKRQCQVNAMRYAKQDPCLPWLKQFRGQNEGARFRSIAVLLVDHVVDFLGRGRE